MAPIAEGLLETLTAAAPPVYLIVDLRVLHSHGACQRGDGLEGLLAFPAELFFDLLEGPDVERGGVVVVELSGGVVGPDYPGLGGDVFYFFEEVPAGPDQHNIRSYYHNSPYNLEILRTMKAEESKFKKEHEKKSSTGLMVTGTAPHTQEAPSSTTSTCWPS